VVHQMKPENDWLEGRVSISKTLCATSAMLCNRLPEGNMLSANGIWHNNIFGMDTCHSQIAWDIVIWSSSNRGTPGSAMVLMEISDYKSRLVMVE